MHTRLFQLACGGALALAALVSSAGPVPAGLSITASVTLDTVNSVAATGSATQSGQLKHRSGGSDSVASFSGDPASVSPTASRGGALTQTGDGIGVRFSASGTDVGTAGALFADFALSLSNSSATDTFTVLFRGLYSNTLTALGPDAYAHTQWSVKDAALNELLFTDHQVDTVNAGNNFSLDSANNSFLVSLLPGESLSFTAFESLIGGSSDSSNFSADLDAFLSIEEIRSSGVNRDLPEPGSLLLCAVALLALSARQLREGRQSRQG